MTNWPRRFQDPITMPDSRIIRTIGEAAEYAAISPPDLDPQPRIVAAIVARFRNLGRFTHERMDRFVPTQ